MSNWRTTAALLLCLAPAHLGAQSELDGTGWTLVRLDLDVTIRPAERPRFAGHARLRLKADSSAGPALTLNSRAPVLRFTRLEVPGARALLNETAAGDSALRLARAAFPKLLRRGDELEVVFAYESDGQSSQLVSAERIALASWVENWYPSPVSPDGYTAAGAAAPGITRFHLPRGWRAVSNGRLASRRVTGSEAIDTWVVDRPVARSFAAAPYVVAREAAGPREVAVHLLSASPAGARAQARTLSRAVGAMERRFGPYPYPSYAIAELPEDAVTWAASSEQGFIMARTSMFDAPGGNLPLFAHEAAHGWWGNAVNTSGPGGKLGSESLAQYGAVVAIEALEGSRAARVPPFLPRRLQPASVRTGILPHLAGRGRQAIGGAGERRVGPQPVGLQGNVVLRHDAPAHGRLGLLRRPAGPHRRLRRPADDGGRHPRRLPRRRAGRHRAR